jgi:hypothetical protein
VILAYCNKKTQMLYELNVNTANHSNGKLVDNEVAKKILTLMYQFVTHRGGSDLEFYTIYISKPGIEPT